MRLWIFSDWHLEHRRLGPREIIAAGFAEADACVVPGDMHTGHKAVAYLREYVAGRMPVIYVPGNHDYYGEDMGTIRAWMAEASRHGPGVHLLDPGTVEIGGVRFVGASLWTDYRLHGDDRRAAAMKAARIGLNDHRLIGIDRRLWTPDDAAARHDEELAHLEGVLTRPFDGPTVVVTHHGPHWMSVHDRYRTGGAAGINPCFVSDLTDVIERHSPALWVHGHVHDSFDYRVGATRVVANPRGYQVDERPKSGETYSVDREGRHIDPHTGELQDYYVGPENRAYEPFLVIEV